MTAYPDMTIKQVRPGSDRFVAQFFGQTLTLSYDQWSKLRDALDDEWITEMEETLFAEADAADREEAAHQMACRAFNGWPA